MTDKQAPGRPASLRGLRRTRFDHARRDLEMARAEDLAQLPPAGLILLVERLRMRLDDMLALLEEIDPDLPFPPR
ncbi:hypothetical protein [Streptomyces griseosporeus]|uniref:hypothetical protein n=1 Tax=Streptomyces griseosporeus TaxID=1910 RepID=UPI0036FBBBB9